MLKCQNIVKKYNKNVFLDRISLEVSSSECLGILGDNGSGKSTLMSIIAGILDYDGGEIFIDDVKISKKSRQKIGYVPQQPVLLENISVKDNIKLWESVYNIQNNIPDFLQIEEFYSKKICDLSGGMKKKVSIAIALMNNPEYLILDEAFSAVDSKTIDNTIGYLKNKKIGILYSSHNINEIIELCDKILVLKNGKISYASNEKIDALGITNIYSKF